MNAIIVRALKDLVRELVEEREKATEVAVRKELYLDTLQDKTSEHYHIHKGQREYYDGKTEGYNEAIDQVNKFIEELENG